MVRLAKLPSAPVAAHTHTLDHGSDLTGLGDDDHPQYLTPAEHTAVGDTAPHHAQLHAAAHAENAADELLAELLGSASLITTQVLKPDGAGGVVFTDILSGDLPVTVVETTDADWVDLTDGGATILHTHAGGSGHTLQDEGVTVAAQTIMDFKGTYLSAQNDAAATTTKIRAGYAHYDGIVDSTQWEALVTDTADVVTATTIQVTVPGNPGWVVNEWARCRVLIYNAAGTTLRAVKIIDSNTSDTITWTGAVAGIIAGDSFIIQPSPPVYRRLAEAIAGNHVSILYREASGELAGLAIGSEPVNYILGDNAVAASISVGVTVTKAGVVFDQLNFAGALTLAGASTVAVGCSFLGTGALPTLSGAGASLIACSYVGSGVTTISSNDCRLQACTWRLMANNLVTVSGSPQRLLVVGCVNIASSETGYLLDMSGAGDSVYSGNIFSQPATATGILRASNVNNVSGNYLKVNSYTTGQITLDLGGRNAVSGNVLSVPSISTTITYTGIVLAGGGNVISSNVLVLNGFNAGTNTPTFRWIDNQIGGNSAGQSLTNNLCFIPVVTSAVNSRPRFHHFSGSGDPRVTISGNVFIGSVYDPPFPWEVSNVIGPETRIDGMSGVPEVVAWRLNEVEDFRNGAIPAGWTGFGAAVPTYPSVRGGVARLQTGTAGTDDSGIRQNLDHVSFDNEAFCVWQAHFNLDIVTNVQAWVGLAPNASWVAGMVRPTNAFILELDTAVDANFHLYVLDGGVTRYNFNLGAAVAGYNVMVAVLDRSNRLYCWFGNGGATATLTSVGGSGVVLPATLLCPGAYVQTLNNVDTRLDVEQLAWGSDQV